MNELLSKLMNNPFVWLILAFCTISPCVISIIKAIWRKEKEISIMHSVHIIIFDVFKFNNKLNIYYDRNLIDDLFSITYYIWNSGKNIISAEDIAGTRLLKIKCNAGCILDAKIIRKSDGDNDFRIFKVSKDCVEIAFEYMDAGEGVTVQILHTGYRERLFLNCKIKGGFIRNCYEKEVFEEGAFFYYSFMLVIWIILLFFVLVIIELLGFFFVSEMVYNIFLIAYGIFAILFSIGIKWIVMKVFHRNVPKKLRV